MRVLYTMLTLAVALCSVAGAAEPPVATAATEVRPVVVGSRLPAAKVHNATGEALTLAEAAGDGKVALIVYRGGWCPICTRHFAALGQARTELEDAGWRFLALSPDRPAVIAEAMAAGGAEAIPRLSDSDVSAIRALGLAFRLDAPTLRRYADYDIDVAAASGQDHHILPVPAVLLVVDGEIRFLHADADYRRRLDAGLLRSAVSMIASADADNDED